ncbi:MAG: exodeoxyribonuclease III [Alphaproteobacteria bacterium]|nr:exodeoxyribonuclease III [Alphaproteobacteria bacterium]
MPLRLTTWNINSVRLRLPLLLRLMQQEKPDVICLQEIKVEDGLFPREAIAAAGYEHQIVRGMKGYNGVAILSRIPLERGEDRSWCDRADSRHAIAMLPGNIELHNFYIPSGGDIPDPVQNAKFAHKLQFLDQVTDWLGAERKRSRPMILVGDLNIAPLECDVWSHKQLLDVVSHTPIEVEKLSRLQGTVEWVDAVRHFAPPPGKLYTWWSYRARDWLASDRGRRLDHVWVTPPLRKNLRSASVLRDARGWQRASDHVPVTIELDT